MKRQTRDSMTTKTSWRTEGKGWEARRFERGSILVIKCEKQRTGNPKEWQVKQTNDVNTSYKIYRKWVRQTPDLYEFPILSCPFSSLFIYMKYCWHRSSVHPGIWDIAVKTNDIIQNRRVFSDSAVHLRPILNVNLKQTSWFVHPPNISVTVRFILNVILHATMCLCVAHLLDKPKPTSSIPAGDANLLWGYITTSPLLPGFRQRYPE